MSQACKDLPREARDMPYASLAIRWKDFAVDSKLADAAIETLQTYQWSKRHAKQSDGAGLRPYVSEMQRVVEKTINHRAKHEEPGSTPVPKELVTV